MTSNRANPPKIALVPVRRLVTAADHDALLARLLSTPPGLTANVRRSSLVDQGLLLSAGLCTLAAFILLAFWAANGPLYRWLVPAASSHSLQAVASHSHEYPLSSSAPAIPAVAPQLAAPASYESPAQPTVSQASGETLAVAPDLAPENGRETFLAPQQIGPAPQAPLVAEPHWLSIPAIDLDVAVLRSPIVDGVWQDVDNAAGYLVGTGLPGTVGNVGVSGHAGLRGAVFRDLPRLAVGDDVYIDAGLWRFHYRVRESHIVWPSQVEVLASRGEAQLTLLTCTNWDLQRLVYVADLVASEPITGQ